MSATRTEFQPAGPADLAPGEAAERAVDGQAILLVRAEDGGYFAVDPVCSHAMKPLDGGRVRGRSIVCPHHGARFCLLSGRVLGPPASAGIGAYPTRVVGDAVEVWLP
jgi:3-phenylpropionate/trans-cinnamate dioxygenase ferredoxin subunit